MNKDLPVFILAGILTPTKINAPRGTHCPVDHGFVPTGTFANKNEMSRTDDSNTVPKERF